MSGAECRRGDRLPVAYLWMLALLPFVHAGLPRAGLRLIPADLLAMPLLLWIVLRDRDAIPALHQYGPGAAAALAAFVFAVGTLAAALVGIAWITPVNVVYLPTFPSIASWLGDPAARSAVEALRMAQCLSSLLATVLLVRTRARFSQACRWFAAGGTAAALYGLYAWTVTDFTWGAPLLSETYVAPALRRTAGPFPEPVAFGGFLLASAVATLFVTEERGFRGLWGVALAVQILALLASMSALALAGFAVLLTAMAIQLRPRAALRLVTLVAIAGAVTLAVVPRALLYTQTIQKPFSSHASWVDRSAGWQTAAAMFEAYPVLGVGPGLYAYNQEPFFPAHIPRRHTGGRVNSIGLEVLAELGALGGMALVVLLIAAVWGVHYPVRRRERAGLRAVGRGGLVVLIVLLAGYYTSRYAFIWVFIGLLVAVGRNSVRRSARRPAAATQTGVACGS